MKFLHSIHIRLLLALLLALISFPLLRYSIANDSNMLHMLPLLLFAVGIILIFLPNSIFKK